MLSSEKILAERKTTKAQADGVWDRLFNMALDGQIQPQALGAAMHQCNKADKALFDDETRYRNHSAASI
jgi:hypothetical protein